MRCETYSINWKIYFGLRTVYFFINAWLGLRRLLMSMSGAQSRRARKYMQSIRQTERDDPFSATGCAGTNVAIMTE